MNIPLLVFAGSNDPPAAPTALQKRRQWTTGPTTMRTLTGNHFFAGDDMLPALIGEACREHMSRITERNPAGCHLRSADDLPSSRARADLDTVGRHTAKESPMSDQEFRETEMPVAGMVPVGTAPPLRLAGADHEDDAEFFTIVRGID
ncbi:hypothetical protein AB0C61_32970 [Streptomyces sp. NPDC048680]|uniref:hypothetical protein n=1 Tax=Streptomyces sp. NPDC048680 TaxID=3155492 RepID=UPI003422272F